MTDAIDIEKIKLLRDLGQNPNSADIIISDFTRACLDKKIPIQDSTNPGNDIQSVILAALQTDAVKQNPDLAFEIITGFTQTCLDEKIPIQDSTNPGNDIQSVISSALQIYAVKRNPYLAFEIITGFTQTCLDKKIPTQDSKNPGNDIQSVISSALQIYAVKQNPDFVFGIINDFTQTYLSQNKSISEIQSVILAAIKQNPDLVFDIIDGFIQACLDKKIPIQDGKNPGNDIQSVILSTLQIDTVKQNPDLVFDIIDGFTRACLSKGQTISKIQSVILEAIKQNPNLVFDIIDGFTQACLLQGKLISDIQPVILEAIKQNPNLAFKIIDGFTQARLSKDKIKELIPVFQNLLEEIQKPEFSVKNKTLLINQIKSFSTVILSEYLQDTLLTLKDESSLSKKDRDADIESQLLNLFKSLYSEVFKDIDKFEDVKLKDLIPIWQIFFVNKIKIQTIKGGKLCEILPFIFDIFKGQDLTIAQLFTDIKPLLQNFYYIDLNCEEGKEQLKKIKEESEKPENKDKPFIVYTVFPNHAVVSIIQNGQISIIDSSHAIFDSNDPQYQQILRDCGFEIDGKKEDELYFNEIEYQENGTCYLNAALAFKCIMEKLLSQQKDKKLEDASTTLNSILSDLKKETGIELLQIDNTIKSQQIIIDVVSQLAKFYETLQQKVDESYLTDGKVLEKDASATATATTEPETEFTAVERKMSSSSLTSEKAVTYIEKEELQRELMLGKITENELAIHPIIIAAIMANASRVSGLVAEFATTIFGAIPKVQENIKVQPKPTKTRRL